MRILITGGSSYLGRRLVPLAAAGHTIAYTYFSANPLDLAGGMQLDVRSAADTAAAVVAFRPAVIVHLAGSNRSPEMAAVITRGAANMRSAAETVGARLLHLSTDVIFDGTAGPYAEADRPLPRHAYGAAKLAAEEIVRGWSDHVIVRTSLIYGLREMDNATAGFVAALHAGQPLTLFTDQLRNPIWRDTLCMALLELLTHPFQGTLHVAGEQALSRAEFGLRLLDHWQITQRDSLRLAPDQTQRFPRDCRLDCSLARELLATPLPGVDAVLAAAA